MRSAQRCQRAWGPHTPPVRVLVGSASGRSRPVALQPEAPHARPGADAVDPGLHGSQRRLELDAEAPEHHDPWGKGGIGEGELLADEVLLAAEAVAQEVESAPEL